MIPNSNLLKKTRGRKQHPTTKTKKTATVASGVGGTALIERGHKRTSIRTDWKNFGGKNQLRYKRGRWSTGNTFQSIKMMYAGRGQRGYLVQTGQ